MSFKHLSHFEKVVGEYFNAPYAISVDSCTHAIELCLIQQKIKKKIGIPKNTYISIPMTAHKLKIKWKWLDSNWENYHFLQNTNIIDAAVFWKKNGYIKNTFMCLSFQHKKHINIGKGGMILTDDKLAYKELLKMTYDGRERHLEWRKQNIKSFGYHYYLTPESAANGIKIFKKKSKLKPKIWKYTDYPDLSLMEVFK
ncbi:DegT/DnrJ/EryC1/StrS family aminotransferase [Pelagibacteraceae bacterium]|jgi:dTDP-4-amino-4,6-dideoxygalactose transaminase|nr:DegT/DnrJ/EryC1/StrS family aminotransferase [Pelagibacteraceae bacterium]